MNILITGASGFYGSILTRDLISQGHNCIGIDLINSSLTDNYTHLICDLRNYQKLNALTKKLNIDVIIHLASMIDFSVSNQEELFNNNIEATKNIALVGKNLGIKSFIFTSSNSIFLGNKNNYISNNDKPAPIDMYGKSKVSCEEILENFKPFFKVTVIRCPNIIDSGRLGMMTILFELIKNNAIIWILGNGSIRHQCIYAKDLNFAIRKLIMKPWSKTYNIGSENVPTFKEMFEFLIRESNSKSKIRSIPKVFAIPILKLLYFFKLSPMGPYQFRMLTRNFEFDISEIKKDLNWTPKKSNSEIILIAYRSFISNSNHSKNFSANRSRINLKFLTILKYFKW